MLFTNVTYFITSQKPPKELLPNAIYAACKGTKYKGLIILPRKTLQVYCSTNAEFCLFLNVEHEKNQTYVKSYTDYSILFMNFPILWTSNI